jgi:hypothetical protein
MPRDEQSHLAKAERNETFAGSFNPKDLTSEEWAITAAFYSALHYVTGYLVHNGQGHLCHKHEDRAKAIATDKTLRGISTAYDYLKFISSESRYGFTITSGTYDRDAKPRLTEIKRHVQHGLKT